jgi:hypothetical protein
LKALLVCPITSGSKSSFSTSSSNKAIVMLH